VEKNYAKIVNCLSALTRTVWNFSPTKAYKSFRISARFCSYSLSLIMFEVRSFLNSFIRAIALSAALVLILGSPKFLMDKDFD
jgi:hypothetical protein